jgi:hypothetical protein
VHCIWGPLALVASAVILDLLAYLSCSVCIPELFHECAKQHGVRFKVTIRCGQCHLEMTRRIVVLNIHKSHEGLETIEEMSVLHLR